MQIHKPLLILGGAKCVWDDIKSLGDWANNVDVAACNDIGMKWPGQLAYWVSLHPKKFKHWEDHRLRNGHPPGYVKYGNKYGRPTVDWVDVDWGGSSGLFAVKIGLTLKYDYIVLAGIPMEQKEGHYFDKKEWTECDRYRAAWERHLKQIKPYVRSCSGWTQRLLGGPILPE